VLPAAVYPTSVVHLVSSLVLALLLVDVVTRSWLHREGALAVAVLSTCASLFLIIA
jgi:hypothetical protein